MCKLRERSEGRRREMGEEDRKSWTRVCIAALFAITPKGELKCPLLPPNRGVVQYIMVDSFIQ